MIRRLVMSLLVLALLGLGALAAYTALADLEPERRDESRPVVIELD